MFDHFFIGNLMTFEPLEVFGVLRVALELIRRLLNAVGALYAVLELIELLELL